MRPLLLRRLTVPLMFLFVTALLNIVPLLTSGSALRVAAIQPTLQPTETAAPLITFTPAPRPASIELPTVDWNDVSIHKAAMKSGYESDVERFVNANRYLIIASVNTDDDAVFTAAERVRYTNRSQDTLDKIVFRLYGNTPALGGRMQVFDTKVDGVAIEPALSNMASVMSLPLNKPLAPGQSAEITMQFTLIMSKGVNFAYGRFGFVRDILSATAWYPTLSVYEPGRGWWDKLPSPQGDPGYTESGLYDVRLTLPADMVVVQSGTNIETTQNANNTITYRNVTGPMRDIAFAASKRYVDTVVEQDGTRIHVMHYKERLTDPKDGTKVVAAYSQRSFQVFNATFGDYPYRDFAIVSNPTPSGVEFPGLVQIAERSWTQGQRYLEVVVAHEIGHQWFYSIVGNDQVGHPWIDESLTSYTEFVYWRNAYPTGTSAAEYVNLKRRQLTSYLGANNANRNQPLNLPVTSYNNLAYGAIIYTKGPVFYAELERLYGQDRVYKALNLYFSRNKYEVATSRDIKAALEESLGVDLTDLFNEWVGDITIDAEIPKAGTPVNAPL